MRYSCGQTVGAAERAIWFDDSARGEFNGPVFQNHRAVGVIDVAKHPIPHSFQNGGIIKGSSHGVFLSLPMFFRDPPDVDAVFPLIVRDGYRFFVVAHRYTSILMSFTFPSAPKVIDARPDHESVCRNSFS